MTEPAISTRVSDLLGVQYPILQAPMGYIARAQLASAVSNAGGMGIIETGSGKFDEIKLELFSSAPVYGAVEVVTIRSWLERAQRDLRDKPDVLAKLLDGKTPAVRAREIVTGSRLFDVYAGKPLPEGKVSLAYALELGAEDRTLTDEEVDALLHTARELLASRFGAEFRG